MKKYFSAFLAALLLFLTACSGTASAPVELAPRLIDGVPTWIFDFNYTNDTNETLSVVALEVLSNEGTEQATGQDLVQEGLAFSDRIAPGETYSIYLTTEVPNPQPEYTYVLTLRKEDNTCFSHTVTYRLTDIELSSGNENAPVEDNQLPTRDPAPSADGSIPLEPENGTDWHFIFDFLNETGEVLTLHDMEVINLVDGQPQSDSIIIPADALPMPSVSVEPGQPFYFEDWHPVVPDFNGRIYLFHFSTASGESYDREYLFTLYGTPDSAQPHQPVSDPDAPADALLPVFADNAYHWQFISAFTNETPDPLTFQELHVLNLKDGQLLDDILLTADNLQHIQRSVEPGQNFLFEDWHPVADFFDERHYVFIFTTPSGEAVEYPFEFPLSMDTTQQRAPLDARAAALPKLDYANDTGYDLIALRHDAAFSMQVAPDVFWVPAVALGQSAYSNQDIHSMLSLSPEEKQQRIHTLYEALQLYEISGFTPSDDNIRLEENGIHWEHHKPGYYAVTTNTGCCATDSNWLNYILRDDYEEVGYIATSQRDGSGHIYNYIKHDGWYYFIDLTSYRACDSRTAIENGEENSYYSTDFVLSNIHRASSPEIFANYVQDTFNDPPGLMFRYTAEDCLALDSLNTPSGVTILYGLPETVDLQVIFDDPNDSLTHETTTPPARFPNWS